MWQAYFSRWKIAWQSSCLYIFTLDSPCRPPLLSPPHPPSPPNHCSLRGSEPLSSPSPPALCQLLFGCGTLFGIHTHLKGTRQGQFLSALGVFSVLGEAAAAAARGGGDFWLGYRLALRGSAWPIIDLSGRRWQQRHVCECSDCY